MKIYHLINKIRRDNNLSIDEFAEKVGIIRQEVTLLEEGRIDVDEYTLYKIKKAFNMTNIEVEKNMTLKEYYKSKNIDVSSAYLNIFEDYEFSDFNKTKYVHKNDSKQSESFDEDFDLEMEVFSEYFEFYDESSEFGFNNGAFKGYDGDAEEFDIPSEYFVDDTSITVYKIDCGSDSPFTTEKVKKITIPATISEIRYNSFDIYKDLEYIHVDPNNPTYKSVDGIVYEKQTNRLVAYPLCNPNDEFHIDKEIIKDFYEYDKIFNAKNLKKIYLSANVKEIDFGNLPSLEEIIVDKENKNFKSIDGVLFDFAFEKLIKYPSNKQKELYIVPDVNCISKDAFLKCSKLRKICIPESVNTILEGAFNKNPNLDIYMCSKENRKDFIDIKGLDKNRIFMRTNYNNICWGYKQSGIELIFTDESKIVKKIIVENERNIPDVNIEKKGYIFDGWEKVELKSSDNFVLKSIQFKAKWIIDQSYVHDFIYLSYYKDSVVGCINKGYEIKIPRTYSYSDFTYEVHDIKSNVFGGNSIKSISIPDTVNSISANAFYMCRSLEQIIVDKNNKFFSSSMGILYNKDMDELISVPSMYPTTKLFVGRNVKTIKSYAFAKLSKVKEIYIPKNVEYINPSAFYFCTATIYCEVKEMPKEWMCNVFNTDKLINFVWGVKFDY